MAAAPIPLPAPLPIDAALPELLAALETRGLAVLQAPPGAGKTTRVPPALLAAPWLAGGKVLLLEPRRLAARAAARRMAAERGEAVGETVGHRIRHDVRVGPRTRIEVVTEGILTRLLQDDPALDGVGAVLFDEFHERSLDADLGLALAMQARALLRPDLRLVVMSATLDGDRVAALLGGADGPAPVISSQGRTFPVETRYLPRGATARLEDAMAATIRQALADEPGSLLAFLPGVAEIRRTEAALADRLPADVDLAPLYGDLPADRQDAAIQPAPPGRRKLVLATAIAETSLTIEGVRIVVDGGLMRRPRFDADSGLTRLETVPVSRAAADQRRGRAGRTEPGVCYRLWLEAAQGALPAFTPPEILTADLAPLALELAGWGAGPGDLAWLDPPPDAALAQARALLGDLGALAADGTPTAHGRALLRLPLHPRLAHLVLAAQARGLGALAADIAAVLEERDLLRPSEPGARDVDLRDRLALLRDPQHRPPPGLRADRGAVQRARESARQIRRLLGLRDKDAADTHGPVGALLALAYPERIGQRREPPAPGAAARFRLSGGRGAGLPPGDPLGASPFLAVASLEAGAADARIFLAAPLEEAALRALHGDRIETVDRIAWDDRSRAVLARRQERLGALVLRDAALPDPDPASVAAALCEGLRRIGPHALPWTPAARAVQARIALLAGLDGPAGDWPACADDALMDGLEAWLAPFLAGLSRVEQLDRLDLATILLNRLTWPQRQRLDREAPSHLTVPSGRAVALDYAAEGGPVLAVKLQEMFGAGDSPSVAGGRVPVTVHLLSPAGRPVQVTRDLAGFWRDGYKAVKAEMKGRYPRHPWPDDPLTAPPARGTKRS